MQMAPGTADWTGPFTQALPIRQTVQPTNDAALPFASQPLLDQLSRPGQFRFVRWGAGGMIEAASEAALAQARDLLAQTYGDLVSFGEPTVHAPAAA